MNYAFTESVLAFTGRERIVKELQDDRAYKPWPSIDGIAYAEEIDALLGIYDWNVQLAQMNLLNSHDTARAITLASDDVRTIELATLLLFTYPGAPTIYYGDEIGLDGGLPDKWARKSFPWEDEAGWNALLREHYQELIRIRQEIPALRQGTYQKLATSIHSYALVRQLGEEIAVVAVNTSSVPDRLVLPTSGTLDLIVKVGDMCDVEATDTGVAISLPARSGGLWTMTHE